MSRPSGGWVPIRAYDKMAPYGVNGFYDIFESIGSVNSANVAVEGVDRYCLGAHPFANYAFTPKSEGTRASVTAAGAFATFSPNGTAMSATNLTLAANDLLFVRARTMFSSEVSSGLGLAASSVFESKLVYNAGAGNVDMPGSRRCVTAGHGWHGWVELMGWVSGAATLSSLTWQYKLTGTMYAAKTVMYGILYKRVNA